MKKRKAIFLAFVAVVLTTAIISIPKAYLNVNEADLKELNTVLSQLEKHEIQLSNLKSNPLVAYPEVLKAQEVLSNKEELLKERDTIEDTGRQAILNYFTLVNEKKDLLGINEVNVNELLDTLDFETLKEYDTYLNTFKDQYRAQIELRNDIYYELNVPEYIDQMSVEDKVGQLFSFSIDGQNISDADRIFFKENNIGGIALFGNNIESKDQLINLTNEIQTLNNSYPLFISTDQEGGQVMRLSWDNSGSHREIATLSQTDQCILWQNRENILIEAGINWNLGVIGDVTNDVNSFIYPRVFSGDYSVVADSVGTAIECTTKSMQTLKHWPGHGATTVDTHTTLGRLTVENESEWVGNENLPFQKAIDSGVSSIMVGHLIMSWLTSDLPASLSPNAINYLRNELGFENLIVTDDLMMLVNSGLNYSDVVRDALIASNDHLFIVTNNQELRQEAINIGLELVKTGVISEEDLDKRVERILDQKNMLIRQMYESVPLELIY